MLQSAVPHSETQITSALAALCHGIGAASNRTKVVSSLETRESLL